MRFLVVTVVHVPTDTRIHARQIRSLLSHGHEVTFAAPFEAYGTDTGALSQRGLSILDLPRASGRQRLSALRAGRAALGEEGPRHDAVLLHDPELLLALPGLLAKLPPVAWDVHEDFPASLDDRAWIPRPARAPAVRLARVLERWAERNVAILLAEQRYADRFDRPHPFVPNLPRLPGDVVVDAPEPRAVHVGRLGASRGVHELIEVGRLLAPEITLTLVGPADPEVRPKVEAAHAAGHVDWRGYLPNDEAMALVPGAAAGLALLADHPNHRVSLSTKVLEYMARRVPVVATPLPLVAAAVEDRGTVVPFEDPAAAAAAVRSYAEDDALWRRQGDAGRQHVEREASWDAVESDFVATLEGLTGRP